MSTVLDLIHENEAFRGLVAGGAIAVLAIPKALLGQLLKLLPATVMPRAAIPSVLGMVGAIGGAALGHYNVFPMDLAIAVGTGAGLASGAAHDMHKSHKERT